MTEPLTDLLHTEAQVLPVPPATPAAVLARGRALRRRRRVASGVAVAVVAVLATALTTTLLREGRDDAVEPSDQEAYLQQGAWTTDGELHIGNHRVPLEDGGLSLNYTSIGVVGVRTQIGQAGPEVLWAGLFTPDGEVRQLTYEGLYGTQTVATDPTAPYLAFGRPSGEGQSEVVVVDLTTQEERVVVPPGPGVRRVRGLSGDVLDYYVDSVAEPALNWRTGADESYLANGFIVGRTATRDLYFSGGWEVWDRSTRQRLLLVPPSTTQDTSLSPDGRWLEVGASDDLADGITVYDVATTRRVSVPILRGEVGWTPDGHLVGRSTDRAARGATEVVICDPADGSCVGTGVWSNSIGVVPGAGSDAR